MPLKAHRHLNTKKHPKHYAKVYWPYMPVLLLVLIGLVLGQSYVSRSQRDVLSYATNISSSDLLSATNQKRQQNQQTPLASNSLLTQAAQAKANDMAKRNYWSHLTPDGQQPWIFIDQTGYAYHKAGENLAYGFDNSAETINGWMNSDAHKANMLDGSYKEAGFGIANVANYIGTGPETIVVALYARPASASPPSQPTTPATSNSITSSSVLTNEPAVRSVSKIQTLTAGRVPGISFAIGLLGGAALAYLLIKHSVGIRRALKKSERFVLHHPLLDVTLLCFIAVCALLSRSVGFIR